MLSIIAAVSSNGVIGNKGQLLWHISEDMRRFRELTTGHPVVMGRKTWESIGKALPNRTNVVVTRQEVTFEGAITAHSLSEALSMFDDSEEVFIIGGSQIYAEAIDLADRMYITEVCRYYEGDAKFPLWDKFDWRKVSSEAHDRGESYDCPFIFEVYERI